MHADPLTQGRRPWRVAGVWLAFSLLQAVTVAIVAQTPDRMPAYLLLHGAIGAAWVALTFVVGIWLLPDADDDWPARILRHVLGLLICGLVDTLVRRVMATALGSSPVLPWYGTLLYFADRTAVSYLAIVLLTRTLAAHDRFIGRQQDSLTLQADVARARLASLEERLHPHFLFNCLGAVTELAHEAPAAAARMLRQLASIIRFALDRPRSEVTVAEELSALESYLEVQRTRFPDWLRIETRVEVAAAQLLMPPLILQPLVENAIRHGLRQRDVAGTIVVSASRREGKLVLEVRDDGVGLHGEQLPGRGIGTTNVHDRLATLYGDEGVLSLFEDPAGGVVSMVTIPAHVRDAQPTEQGADSGLSSVLRRWPGASIAVGWGVWGLLWTQQSIAYLAFRDRLAGQSLLHIAGRDFLQTMLWAALTPVMLLTARFVPVTGRRLPLRFAAHAIAAVAIASTHEWAARRLLYPDGPSLSPEAVAATAWGILAYAVVLAAANHGQIQGWLRERDLVDARLRVSIAEAELEQSYLRARPQQLLDRLEAIAESIQHDAAAAERALARLGDDLRESLDAVPA